MNQPLPPDFDSLEPTPDELRAQLRELTGKSWNLELIISGAALFATLRMPEVLLDVYEYYRYNLLLQRGSMYETIPSLMFSLTKATSYVLFGAFLLNFIMRAYWVSLVGLLAVYPSGIHYDRIPFYNDLTKSRLAAELGPLPAYIRQLDRRCNTVFSLAFLLVIMLLLIALSYGAMIGIVTLEKAVLPVRIILGLNYTLLSTYFGFVLALLILTRTRWRNHPRLAPWQFRLQRVGRLFFFGLYKPVSYVILMFSSNVSRGLFQRSMVIFFLVLAGVMYVQFQVDYTRRKGSTTWLNDRLLYDTRSDRHRLNADAYTNRRPINTLILSATIPSEVIRTPYLTVFVAYPKSLDTLFAQAGQPPALPDSVDRNVRSSQHAIWSLNKLSQAFTLYLDDTRCAPPDFLFTEFGDRRQRGVETVLILPPNFQPGKHLLRITVKGSQKPIDYATIPFWYVPE